MQAETGPTVVAPVRRDSAGRDGLLRRARMTQQATLASGGPTSISTLALGSLTLALGGPASVNMLALGGPTSVDTLAPRGPTSISTWARGGPTLVSALALGGLTSQFVGPGWSTFM